MKIWEKIKFCLYIISGVFILVFNYFLHLHVHYVDIVVGTVMLAYAVEDMVISCIKGIVSHKTKFFESIVLISLAIVLMFFTYGEYGYQTRLIIWGTWSILREGDEITECVVRMTHKRPAFISLAESIVVIVLSIAMIVDPVEHHAHVHMILLGIELILEVIFPIFYGFLDKKIEKKLGAKAASTEE